jgi:hypothetical protein
MDPVKVQTILEWQTLSSISDVHQLLLQIHKELFEDCVASYITHQEKSNIFWTTAATKAFTELDEAFTSAPVLAHIDPEKPFTIEVGALDFALGSILSQPGEDGQLHLVVFH